MLTVPVATVQGIEGISLACTFLDAGYGRIKFALFSIAFILITPIGIGKLLARSQPPAARTL